MQYHMPYPTIFTIHITVTADCITPFKIQFSFFFFLRFKESGTAASKQKNIESTPKVTNDPGERKKVKVVKENNQTQKDGF